MCTCTFFGVIQCVQLMEYVCVCFFEIFAYSIKAKSRYIV